MSRRDEIRLELIQLSNKKKELEREILQLNALEIESVMKEKVGKFFSKVPREGRGYRELYYIHTVREDGQAVCTIFKSKEAYSKEFITIPYIKLQYRATEDELLDLKYCFEDTYEMNKRIIDKQFID